MMKVMKKFKKCQCALNRFADTIFFTHVALKSLDKIGTATGKGREHTIYVSTIVPYFQRAVSELLARKAISGAVLRS